MTTPDGGGTPHRTPRRSGASQGQDARRWFLDRGFELRAEAPHVICDELESPGFRMARIWHTAGALRLVAPRRSPRLLLQLEGDSVLTLTASARSETVRSGDLVFLPGGVAFELDQQAPTARFDLELDALTLPLSTLRVVQREVVIPTIGVPLAPVLIATINAAFNAGVAPSDTGFAEFRLAIVDLASAALTSAAELHRPRRTTRESELFAKATAFIVERAADPSFSVAGLTSELQVSAPYLRRIFAAHGTTARREIRRRRVALAEMYRGEQLGGAVYTAEEAARFSGFRDADAMREALHHSRRSSRARDEQHVRRTSGSETCAP